MRTPKSGQLRDFTAEELKGELAMRETIREFIFFAEGALDLPTGHIMIRSRRPGVARPRHIVMAALREAYPKIQQMDVARAMGLTDASSVAYAQRQGEDCLLLRNERDGLVAAWRVIHDRELDLNGVEA